MARVLIPVHARRYNPNPRGSSTTTVMMRADNPFESRSTIINGQRSGSMPGMGGLGDAPVPATSPVSSAPAAASTGIDWTKLLTGVSQVGVQVGGQLAQNAIQQHYGQLPAQQPMLLPTQTHPGLRVAQPSSWVPIAVIGGAAVLGIGILFMARKSGKRR